MNINNPKKPVVERRKILPLSNPERSADRGTSSLVVRSLLSSVREPAQALRRKDPLTRAVFAPEARKHRHKMTRLSAPFFPAIRFPLNPATPYHSKDFPEPQSAAQSRFASAAAIATLSSPEARKAGCIPAVVRVRISEAISSTFVQPLHCVHM